MIARFPNNNVDHRLRAEQRKNTGDEVWRKSLEAIEEQSIELINIRRDVGTTTSNDKPKSYKHARRKPKGHQSDVSAEVDCRSNQTFDINVPDQRKTQKQTQPQSRQQSLLPFNRKQSSNIITPSNRRNQQTTD